MERLQVSEKPIIYPTKPWETWAVFAYNSVIKVSETEYRMYYDAIELGTGVPPGFSSPPVSSPSSSSSSPSSPLPTGATVTVSSSKREKTQVDDDAPKRYICLATSSDGINWDKPSLGVYQYKGSGDNNIIMEDSGASAFYDKNPDVPENERWKVNMHTLYVREIFLRLHSY